MKNLLIYSLLVYSSIGFATTNNNSVDEPYINENDQFAIVEKPYSFMFKKQVFEAEISRIEKILDQDNGKTKLMEFEVKGDQGHFVSRYFKKAMYDAYFQDNKVKIYTKRMYSMSDY